MGLFTFVSTYLDGYVGSWRRYATGYPDPEQREEFSWPTDPSDRRSHIPRGVPVEGNLTRIWYFSAWRNRGKIRRFMTRASFKLYKRAVFDLDYGGQDYRAAKSVRYNNPERLSASDSHLIQIRTLITEYGRGLDNEHVRRRVVQETLADNTTGEANPGQSPDVENEGEQLGDGYTTRVESS